MARWPDGSVKWLLVDTMLQSDDRGQACWSLARSSQGPRTPPRRRAAGQEADDEILIVTGAATFRVGRDSGLLGRVQVDEQDVVAPGSTRLLIADAGGRVQAPSVEVLALEAGGPVRATVRLEGRFGGRPPAGSRPGSASSPARGWSASG